MRDRESLFFSFLSSFHAVHYAVTSITITDEAAFSYICYKIWKDIFFSEKFGNK